MFRNSLKQDVCPYNYLKNGVFFLFLFLFFVFIFEQQKREMNKRLCCTFQKRTQMHKPFCAAERNRQTYCWLPWTRVPIY